MSRRRVLAIVAFVAVVVGVALALLVPADCGNTKSSDETTVFKGIEVEYLGKEYCEILVDLGYVKRSATAQESIRLTNRSNYPIVLVDYTTQCRCMWLDFEREAIAPNQSADITLTFDSRGEWGSVGNYMEIMTSVEGAPIVLWIAAEIE